jgi:hypothetical protein
MRNWLMGMLSLIILSCEFRSVGKAERGGLIVVINHLGARVGRISDKPREGQGGWMLRSDDEGPLRILNATWAVVNKNRDPARYM